MDDTLQIELQRKAERNEQKIATLEREIFQLQSIINGELSTLKNNVIGLMSAIGTKSSTIIKTPSGLTGVMKLFEVLASPMGDELEEGSEINLTVSQFQENSAGLSHDINEDYKFYIRGGKIVHVSPDEDDEKSPPSSGSKTIEIKLGSLKGVAGIS